MDVSLSDEERWFQQSVRAFLEKELAPRIDDYEEREEFPREILPKLGAQGFLGVGFPEDLDFRQTDSLGLQLVCVLTEQLEGTIELAREGGTRFTLTFPVEHSVSQPAV